MHDVSATQTFERLIKRSRTLGLVKSACLSWSVGQRLVGSFSFNYRAGDFKMTDERTGTTVISIQYLSINSNKNIQSPVSIQKTMII